MKKLVLTLTLATSLFAESLSLTGLAFSKHNNDGYNESHDWIGLKYEKEWKDYRIGAEIANFKNSYNKDTKMGVAFISWLPVEIGNFKAGVSASAGIQKGYCMDGFIPTKCNDGQNDFTAIVIPSVQMEYNIKKYAIGTNITYADGVLARMYLTLVRW